MRTGSSPGRIARVAAAFVVAWPVAGCAKRARSDGAWQFKPWSEDVFTGRHVTSDHFQIYSTLTDAELEAALPDFTECAFQQYTSVLPCPLERTVRLRLYVLATRGEWLRFVRQRFADDPEACAGAQTAGCTGKEGSAIYYVDRARALAAIAHEGWHQYADVLLERSMPLWLDEGLACSFESVEYIDAQPKFHSRRNTFRTETLRELVYGGGRLSVSEVINAPPPQLLNQDRQRADQFYSQAWALTDFLRHGADGRYARAFSEMIQDIRNGTFAVHAGAARLTRDDGAGLTAEESVFLHYFGQAPDELDGPYGEHVVRLVGY